MASERMDADPRDGRDETQTERLDRNWDEILQELRVIQTGTQILTGFLLTIPFQQRFTDLSDYQLGIYLFLVGFAALATILALAPVSLHRALFRRKAKPEIVGIAHVLMRCALIAIAVTLSGTTWLIFDVVVGHPIGIAAGVVTLLLTSAAWALLPMLIRPRLGAPGRRR